MKRLLLLPLLLLLAWQAFGQNSPSRHPLHTVTLQSEVKGASIILFDKEGQVRNIGQTPVTVALEADSTHFYHVRHSFCHPDSGYFHVADTTKVISIPVRPYRTEIHWQGTPAGATYSLEGDKHTRHQYEGEATGQTSIYSGRYLLQVRRKDYRTYRRHVTFQHDTTLTIEPRMQYCPKRLIVALNAGYGSKGSIPLGVTVAYGGVHGIYARYTQTLLTWADGDDFEAGEMFGQLTVPYTEGHSDYLSLAAGYQYLSPQGFYCQAGIGYGMQAYSWKSTQDGLRHRFAPDTHSGILLDLGIGRTFGHLYLGAAVQALCIGTDSFFATSALLQAGFCL